MEEIYISTFLAAVLFGTSLAAFCIGLYDLSFKTKENSLFVELFLFSVIVFGLWYYMTYMSESLIEVNMPNLILSVAGLCVGIISAIILLITVNYSITKVVQ